MIIKPRRSLHARTNFQKQTFKDLLILFLLIFCLINIIILQSNQILESNSFKAIADKQDSNWINSSTIYNFKAQDINGREIYLNQYK